MLYKNKKKILDEFFRDEFKTFFIFFFLLKNQTSSHGVSLKERKNFSKILLLKVFSFFFSKRFSKIFFEFFWTKQVFQIFTLFFSWVQELYALRRAHTVLWIFLKNFHFFPTKPGHFSRTLSKGPNTTTWIWNLHADAHDFDSHTSDLEEISRKVFSAHFGQLGVIFIWLSGCETIL